MLGFFFSSSLVDFIVPARSSLYLLGLPIPLLPRFSPVWEMAFHGKEYRFSLLGSRGKQNFWPLYWGVLKSTSMLFLFSVCKGIWLLLCHGVLSCMLSFSSLIAARGTGCFGKWLSGCCCYRCRCCCCFVLCCIVFVGVSVRDEMGGWSTGLNRWRCGRDRRV